MAYYVNAASDDPDDPPATYVMTARDARTLAVAYTTAHARNPSAIYDPAEWPGYRWPSISRDLRNDLAPTESATATPAPSATSVASNPPGTEATQSPEHAQPGATDLRTAPQRPRRHSL